MRLEADSVQRQSSCVTTMDQPKRGPAEEAVSTSLSSNEVSYDRAAALNSSYSMALEKQAMAIMTTALSAKKKGPNGGDSSFEVSYGDASDLVQVEENSKIINVTPSTSDTLTSEEHKDDTSPPSYIHNFVGDDPFSTSGLPSPPILLDTRIGSENSAFSSVSGVVRPIPSKLGSTPSSTPDRSKSSTSLPSNGGNVHPTPSPASSKSSSVKEAPRVVSPEETQSNASSTQNFKSGPQRRLQLFERASRLAHRARRKSKTSKPAKADKKQEESEELDNLELEILPNDPPSSGSAKVTVTPSSESPSPPPPPPPPAPSSPPETTPSLSPSPVTEAVAPSTAVNSTTTESIAEESSISIPAATKEEVRSVSPESTGRSKTPSLPPQNSMELSAAPVTVQALYAKASPLARMRSDRAQEAAAMSPEAIAEAEAAAAKAAKVFESQKKTEEEIVAERHRRWRRSLRNAKRKQQRQLEGDYDSLGGEQDGIAQISCDADNKILSLLRMEFSNLLQNGCGNLEDIIIDKDMSFDEDSMMSEDSQSFYTDNDSETADSTHRRRGRSKQREGRRRRERAHSPSPAPTEEKTISQSSSMDDQSATEDEQERGAVRTLSFPDDEVAESAFAIKGSPHRPKNKDSPLKKKGVGINDKHFIKSFIEEASQEGMSFIWHKEAKTSQSLSQSSRVQLHLKLGHVDNEGRFVGPRLDWDEQDHNESFVEEGRIDLFDIQSVEKSTAVQMQNYPFAVPGNSFFVRKNDGKDYVFEASSDEEARRFIHGLRWLVARLAFNLIIGNRDVSCELFCMPGEGDESNIVLSGGYLGPTEARESKAMNDVTNHLVEKIVFHTMEM